ncbi:MAG: hypothetical protein ACRDHE_17025 [Ktedonobacterales bacterium]
MRLNALNPDVRVLVAIGYASLSWTHLGPTFTDLAGATQLGGDGLRAALLRLERKGLIAGGQDPSLTRYRYQYRLTDSGNKAYEEASARLLLPEPPAPHRRPSALAERLFAPPLAQAAG